MSSPSRMLRGRPTAPLPTQYASNSFSPLHKDELSEENSIAERSSPTFSGQPNTSSAYSPAQHCCTYVDFDLVSDLVSSEDSVRDYLRFHKTFLEEFILEDVPQETLERILIRKAQRKNSASEFEETVEYEFPKALSRWKFCVHSDKQELIHSLTRSIHDGEPFNSILLQLSKSIADAVKANVSELLLVESDALVPAVDDSDKTNTVSVDICIGGSVEGFVAATKQVVKTNILDERINANFPEGTRLTQRDSAVASVLCVPILQGDDSLLGVLAMGRKATEPQFASEDEEIIKSYLSWAAVALYSAQEHSSCLQQKKLNDTYKQLTKLMLESQPDCKTILEIIDDTVTKTVNADRAALFLVDSEGKNLYAQVFTVSREEEDLVTMDHLEPKCFGNYLNQLGRKMNVVSYKGSNVAISIDKGVVGYTAKTGKLINVTDAKNCPYFSANVDELTGYTTNTLLCAPLTVQGRVLGVLEAVNKKGGGVFTYEDEKSLQTLAEFCSLLVSTCRMKENLSLVENRLEVTQEILAYHRPCSEGHYQRVKNMTLSKEEEQQVQNMSVDTAALSLDNKVQLVLTMFTDLVDVYRYQFDLDQCLRFALTVAKNYRNEEYHNWDHAFSVAHCMYWILKGAPAERFSELEKISLFWGCLCHDLDHRGHNNTFLVKTGAPLAKLYSSSILENHHFSQALSLLRLEGHDIFSCLSTEQYNKLLTIMQKAILATDLVQFFSNKDKFSKITNSGGFSWDVPQHKELVISLMMTTSDLCSSCKPWEKHRYGVMALFEEFYMQGDEEKTLGLTPLEMMDRNFKHKLPSCQVGFLKSIACPCSELLLNALPHVEKLLRGAQNNMEMWEKISQETTMN